MTDKKGNEKRCRKIDNLFRHNKKRKIHLHSESCPGYENSFIKIFVTNLVTNETTLLSTKLKTFHF